MNFLFGNHKNIIQIKNFFLLYILSYYFLWPRTFLSNPTLSETNCLIKRDVKKCVWECVWVYLCVCVWECVCVRVCVCVCVRVWPCVGREYVFVSVRVRERNTVFECVGKIAVKKKVYETKESDIDRGKQTRFGFFLWENSAKG